MVGVVAFILGVVLTAAIFNVLWATQSKEELTTSQPRGNIGTDMLTPAIVTKNTVQVGKGGESTTEPSRAAEQSTISEDPPSSKPLDSLSIELKGVAGAKAFAQLTKPKSPTPESMVLSEGDTVMGHWVVEAVEMRPTSVTLRNEKTGRNIELHPGDSITLSIE
ncbi:MAG: hypothetical protein HZB26_07540 [Candidatus Hydrogenedentes bacterium]|nr:hypothetical protein [Candidatus Hydrogenedentota bacterium]